ncbi:hypothetical protein AVEN_64098-1 [Araneus ventricosus]|uniref:Uncharacterized protein n=1 Tax=Araneus ventricosus TaxID=182803 RepID=A0A4Y2C632_ARAVE|nr:hypothetical protein AVEN_64098-1 [Araneus ventricosus]
MMTWTIEHRVFTCDCFIKNSESVTAVQGELRSHFNKHKNQAVSSRVTILRWVLVLRTRCTLMRKRPSGVKERYLLRKCRKHQASLSAQSESICLEAFF